ncbi:MAG: NAD-dependent epimerase/dehydratase family protein [Collinsella aerofaciens]
MRVLVTGARGFVGRNLCCALKNIRDGKDRRAKYQPLLPLEVMEYDVDSTPGELEDFCSRADFVFNLAGVNRPKDQSEFMEGNFGFASTLLDTLERHGNRCPVMLSSSAQASLSGRFEGSVYGESKLAGRGCSASTRSAPAPQCSSTASPTSTASGAARATTRPWPPSATPSRTAAPTP